MGRSCSQYVEKVYQFGEERPLPEFGEMQILVENGVPRAVDFLCPCGCGHTCYTRVVPFGSPNKHKHVWFYSKGPKLDPSIRWLSGCMAHFNIEQGGKVKFHNDSGAGRRAGQETETCQKENEAAGTPQSQKGPGMSTNSQDVQRIRLLKYPSKVDFAIILEECNKMKFWVDGSGALMAIRPSDKPGFLAAMPGIQAALAEISKARNSDVEFVMVNRLPPGCKVPIHTDNLIHRQKRERWHLPIVTNPLAYWWDAYNGEVEFDLGYWHGPVAPWVNHKVENLGTTERIHLVVDLMRNNEHDSAISQTGNLGC